MITEKDRQMNFSQQKNVLDSLVNQGVEIVSETVEHVDHFHLLHTVKWRSVFAGIVFENNQVWLAHTSNGEKIVETFDIEDDTEDDITAAIVAKLVEIQIKIDIDVALAELFGL